MAKQYFLPTTDLAKLAWLQNFASKIAGYAVKYNLSTAEVDDVVAGALYYAYWLNGLNLTDEYKKKFTQFKNELRDGIPAGASPSVVPAPPTLGVAPTAVAPGIFFRAVAIANVIKSKSNYTNADGVDLGIEGAELTTDPNEMQVAFTIRLAAGGHPELVWKKLGMDGIEIYVDRGTGTFAFLALDTIPNYTDTHALPAAGATAIWKYKAIYRLDDEQAGQWSDVVSVTVTGV